MKSKQQEEMHSANLHRNLQSLTMMYYSVKFGQERTNSQPVTEVL